MNMRENYVIVKKVKLGNRQRGLALVVNQCLDLKLLSMKAVKGKISIAGQRHYVQ
jgi:hypothetical protein